MLASVVHFVPRLTLGYQNTTALFYVFRLRDEESLLGRHHEEVEGAVADSSGTKMRKIMSLKITHLFAFFILV